MRTGTPSQILAEAIIGERLDLWVAQCRGAGMSWQAIAAELKERTLGRVDVNRETIRTWYRELDFEGAVQ
jgi:hypothetical protein